ncbi:MAG: hypothetical protein FWD65_03520 [Coriobacteriia bacterium]|nr:hypothetical protein [Coriobacteriia bacterium]
MIESNQWAELFELARDRKPTPQEFTDAKDAEFSLDSLGEVAPEKAQQVWVAAFEKLKGRKPVPDEFMSGKTADFALSSLGAEEAPEVPEAPTSAAPVGAEPTEVLPLIPPQTGGAQPTQQMPVVVVPPAPAAPVAGPAPAQAPTPAPPSPVSPAPPAPKPPRERKPLTKKTKLMIGLIAGGVVLIWLLVSAGYFFFNYFGASPVGFSFYGIHQSSTLTRYVADYNKKGGLGSTLQDWYVWADTKKPVKAADIEVKPELPKSVVATSLLPGTSMKKTGNKFLIFPDYKVVVMPQNLTVRANTAGLTLSVGQKELGASTSADYSTSVARLFPGTYEVFAKGTVNQEQVDISQIAELTSGSTEANFALTFITFHLYSNLTNGDVYVGSSKIGSLTKGDYKFTNIPVLAGQELQVRKEFADGLVKTGTITIDSIEDGSSVYLNWSQKLSMDAATSLFGSAVEDFSALAYSGSSNNNDLGQIFDGGAANPLYQLFSKDITNKTTPLKGYTPSSISLSGLNVNSITQTGVNTYNVAWSLQWDFGFYSVTNSDNTKEAYGDYYQVFSYTTEVRYVPGQNAADENAQADSGGAGTDSGTDSSRGSGDDSANFIISKLIDHKLLSSNKQVQISDVNSWW